MERERSAGPRDPYKGVTVALLAASATGTVGAVVGGLWLGDLVVLAAAIALGLASGILIGVACAQELRLRAGTLPPEADAPAVIVDAPESDEITAAEAESALRASRLSALGQASLRAARQLRKAELDLNNICILAGGSAILLLLTQTLQLERPSGRVARVTAGLFLLAAGAATLAARYLARLGRADAAAATPFPESVGLARGARVLAWVLLLVAATPALAWEGLYSAVHFVYLLVLAFDAAICVSLFRARKRQSVDGLSMPLNFAVLAIFGRRANIFASALDAAEQQLGTTCAPPGRCCWCGGRSSRWCFACAWSGGFRPRLLS